MPSLRVVAGSALVVAAFAAAPAFGQAEVETSVRPAVAPEVADTNFLISQARISKPLGSAGDLERFVQPAASVLVDAGRFQAVSVVEPVPMDTQEQHEAQGNIKPVRLTFPTKPAVAAAVTEVAAAPMTSAENSSPVTMSVIGAAALAVLGGTAAIVSWRRRA